MMDVKVKVYAKDKAPECSSSRLTSTTHGLKTREFGETRAHS